MSQLRTRCDAHHKKALYNLRFSICNAATARSNLASSRPWASWRTSCGHLKRKAPLLHLKHPDPTVDVSAVPVEMGNLLAYDARAIRNDLSLLKPDEFTKMNIGWGILPTRLAFFSF
jgi:hypothetical protein